MKSNTMAAGACSELRDRVRAIAALQRKGAAGPLAVEVRALRLAAHAWRFEAVEILAGALELDLASIGTAAVVNAYLERMDDAIDCIDPSPRAVDSMLATVRARMNA